MEAGISICSCCCWIGNSKCVLNTHFSSLNWQLDCGLFHFSHMNQLTLALDVAYGVILFCVMQVSKLIMLTKVISCPKRILLEISYDLGNLIKLSFERCLLDRTMCKKFKTQELHCFPACSSSTHQKTVRCCEPSQVNHLS